MASGPRQCIGRKFATTEAVAFLTLLLRDWKVEPLLNDGETNDQWKERVMQGKLLLTLGIRNVPLRFIRRMAKVWYVNFLVCDPCSINDSISADFDLECQILERWWLGARIWCKIFNYMSPQVNSFLLHDLDQYVATKKKKITYLWVKNLSW